MNIIVCILLGSAQMKVCALDLSLTFMFTYSNTQYSNVNYRDMCKSTHIFFLCSINTELYEALAKTNKL